MLVLSGRMISVRLLQLLSYSPMLVTLQAERYPLDFHTRKRVVINAYNIVGEGNSRKAFAIFKCAAPMLAMLLGG